MSILSLRIPWRYKKEPWEKWPPQPRPDPETFVLHGDNMWGDAIALFPDEQPEEPNTLTCVGWTTPLPKPGDYLVVKCQSGKWGRFILTRVAPAQGVYDMWFGTAVGPHEYVDEPNTKSATEFVKRRGVFR